MWFDRRGRNRRLEVERAGQAYRTRRHDVRDAGGPALRSCNDRLSNRTWAAGMDYTYLALPPETTEVDD